MLESGPAVKVTLHLNRDTGSKVGFLPDDIVAFLQKSGVTGATVLQPHSGFGSHRQLHTSGAGDVGGLHLPAVIYFVETEEKVTAILPALLAMVTDGLVEAHPTTILKNVTSAEKVIS